MFAGLFYDVKKSVTFLEKNVVFYLGGDIMTFDEKLKTLRKSKNITQDELAQKLYVSRTAISKWESGKGYPSIETLKMLAAFYEVSIDDLVSNEEILDITTNTIERNKRLIISLLFCLLDIVLSLSLLFIPLYGLDIGDRIVSVGLFYSHYSTIEIVLDLLFISLNLLHALTMIILIFFNKEKALKHLPIISCILTGLLVALFLSTRESYAGLLSLSFLGVKIIIILKK